MDAWEFENSLWASGCVRLAGNYPDPRLSRRARNAAYDWLMQMGGAIAASEQVISRDHAWVFGNNIPALQ
jgi:hypothetical protein